MILTHNRTFIIKSCIDDYGWSHSKFNHLNSLKHDRYSQLDGHNKVHGTNVQHLKNRSESKITQRIQFMSMAHT